MTTAQSPRIETGRLCSLHNIVPFSFFHLDSVPGEKRSLTPQCLPTRLEICLLAFVLLLIIWYLQFGIVGQIYGYFRRCGTHQTYLDHIRHIPYRPVSAAVLIRFLFLKRLNVTNKVLV